MTFIASVIAKKGVAIIADSLVTSQMPILHYGEFLKYIRSLPDNGNGGTAIDLDDILELFNSEPVFTKDYEEKLFQLNKFTAVTTTGAAYINEKNISDLIEEFKSQTTDINDMAVPFEHKLQQFSSFLNAQVREHIIKYDSMDYCAFLFTYYERHSHNTHVYKMYIQEIDSEYLNDLNYNYVNLQKQLDWMKVVCDGQNKLSEKILYGTGKELFQVFPKFLDNLIRVLNIQNFSAPENLNDVMYEDEYFRNFFWGNIELLNLTELSVQQAVDLACLLMRLEVDFQKYTKNIPTVGGVIKLAVIDESGFRFISGHNIEAPKHIII